MGKNSSLWTKVDPLKLLASFEFTTLAVWTQQNLLLFLNLNTNVILVKPRSKTSLDFLNNLNFTAKKKKKENLGKMWVVDAGYVKRHFLYCL